eukprot:510167_1
MGCLLDVDDEETCTKNKDGHTTNPQNNASSPPHLTDIASDSISPAEEEQAKFEDAASDHEPQIIPDSTPLVDEDSANLNHDTSSPHKIHQLAQMIDLNTVIQEDAETGGVDIPQDIDSESKSEESSDSCALDTVNKQMTCYEITDDMASNIESLIEQKIAELEECKYTILQASSSTKCGKKDGKTKRNNQDSLICLDRFGPSNILQFYGVLDGHGPSGHNVSQYCAEHLPKILVKDKKRILTTLCKPAYSLIISFEELEKQLDADKESGKLKFDLTASGTTITCGLRVGDHLYLANLGDSKALLGSYGSGKKVRTRALTDDHDPQNADEAIRIAQSRKGRLLVEDDGTSRIHVNFVDDKHSKPRPSLVQLKQTYGVDALQRLNAVSASVSRSIGDKLAHKYAGVISKPDVIIHKFNSSDLFVMWASDGIWTVCDNEDVTRIIGNKLKTVVDKKHYEDLHKINEKLVREAHIVWQDEFDDYVDDITSVIVRIGIKEI